MEQKKIRELEERIETYDKVLSNSGSYQSAVTAIDQEIYKDLGEIADLSKKGNASVFEKAELLTIEIMKKKIASGDLVHYDETLKELRAELKRLKTASGASVKNISTSGSGYFSLGTDGLEGKMTLDRMNSLDTENFDSVSKEFDQQKAQTENLGKVVRDSNWYVAIKVKTDKIARLEIKDTVYIRIPSFGEDRIKCTVADIRKNGKDCILVLSSSIIGENILMLRKEEIQLIVETHSGIQIRQSALRKVDGEEGVFVKVGLLLKYKKVKVLYNNGTNVIVEYDAAANSGLRIYDQVVYKGSNLYSGKAVTDG
jgi:putative membrane fusion protein